MRRSLFSLPSSLPPPQGKASRAFSHNEKKGKLGKETELDEEAPGRKSGAASSERACKG